LRGFKQNVGDIHLYIKLVNELSVLSHRGTLLIVRKSKIKPAAKEHSMKLRYALGIFSCFLLMWTPLLYSAEAPELSVRQAIQINAPANEVWDVVSDFGGIHNWLIFIKDTKITLGKNRQKGAIRLLTRGNGTKIEERLVAYDPSNMTASYSYVQGVPLSSDYYSTMTVKSISKGLSQVEWKATFRRVHYWRDTPPGARDDETLVKLYNKIYEVGLKGIKDKIESGSI
jgi:mxaD protein